MTWMLLHKPECSKISPHLTAAKKKRANLCTIMTISFPGCKNRHLRASRPLFPLKIG